MVFGYTQHNGQLESCLVSDDTDDGDQTPPPPPPPPLPSDSSGNSLDNLRMANFYNINQNCKNGEMCSDIIN